MMKLIKYETVILQKKDILDFIITTLQQNGWTSVSSNEANEGWIYHSKGTNGKSNIIVNIRDGYNAHKSGSYTYSTTNNRTFEMRMLISYQPNEVMGKNGTSVPALNNDNYSRVYVGMGSDYTYSDLEFTIRYNCNADRMIICLTPHDLSATGTFIMFGKPSDNIAKEYSDTGNLFLTQHAYRYLQGTWGIADRPTAVRTNVEILTRKIDKSIHKGKVTMSEIVIATELEGVKGTVEGLYVLDVDSSMENNSINDDKIVDDLGNEFSLMHIQRSTASNYGTLLSNRVLAVCTKLAGE